MTTQGGRADEATIGAALDDDGMAVVSLLGFRMITADAVAERSDAARRVKLAARDDAGAAVASTLVQPPPDAAPWRHDLARTLDGKTDYAQRAALSAAASSATTHISTRADALAVLVELATFSPWPAGISWVTRARTRALEQAAVELDEVTPADVSTIEDEVAAQLRAMARARISWGRVAALGAIGVGMGAATMGVAAPAVGAMVGSAAGLTGAAATSAGLAMLGGGSLAAGGLGITGGTAILVGAGGLVGAGVGASGARAAYLVTSGLAREVVRTEVHTRIVVIGEKSDDEAARRVVVAMERRLDDVTAKLHELAARLRTLAEEKKGLQGELKDARDEVTAVIAEKDDLRLALESEQARAELAEVALKTALKRLNVSGSDDNE